MGTPSNASNFGIFPNVGDQRGGQVTSPIRILSRNDPLSGNVAMNLDASVHKAGSGSQAPKI